MFFRGICPGQRWLSALIFICAFLTKNRDLCSDLPGKEEKEKSGREDDKLSLFSHIF